MINDIITEPQFQGYVEQGYTTPTVPLTLASDANLAVYGVVSLKIAGEREKFFRGGVYRGKELTVDFIMKKWGKLIKRRHYTTIFIGGFTNVRTYEYNKKDGIWYLVQVNTGF